MRLVPGEAAVKREVADGTLAGGVVVSPGPQEPLAPPHPDGGSRAPRPSPGFDVVDRANALIGQEYAESRGGRPGQPALRRPPGAWDGHRHGGHLASSASTLGNGGKAVLDYFAPSIAVVFLFIGSGLGMRSLLMERSTGTLARLAAAPIRPSAIVVGEAAGHRA